MKFKVFWIKDNSDVTDDEDWYLTSNGRLCYWFVDADDQNQGCECSFDDYRIEFKSEQ